MTLRSCILLASLPMVFAISACSAEATVAESETVGSASVEEASDEAMTKLLPVDADVPEVEAMEEVASEPEVTAVATDGEIPAQFIGVWDYVGGTCAPESDLRLEISQDTFVFYESVGAVRFARFDGEVLRVDLAMSGEGETWRDLLRLTIEDDGNLHVVDGATPDAVDEFPRKRCDG